MFDLLSFPDPFELLFLLNLMVFLLIWPLLGIVSNIGFAYIQKGHFTLNWQIYKRQLLWGLIWPGIPILGGLILYVVISEVEISLWILYWGSVLVIGRFFDSMAYDLINMELSFTEVIFTSFRNNKRIFGLSLSVQFVFFIIIVPIQTGISLVLPPVLAIILSPFYENFSLYINFFGFFFLVQVITLSFLIFFYYRGYVIGLILESNKNNEPTTHKLNDVAVGLFILFILAIFISRIIVVYEVFDQSGFLFTLIFTILLMPLFLLGMTQISNVLQFRHLIKEEFTTLP